MAVLASAALLCAGMAFAATAAPAAAKKKSANPLAGSYSATSTDGTGAPVSINFRITKSGAVLWTPPTVSLFAIPLCVSQPVPCGPPEPCPGFATGTISVSSPLHLQQRTPSLPNGKKILYSGAGGSPPGRVDIAGTPIFGAHNRFTGAFEGFASLHDVQSDGRTCAAGTKKWQATRVGGK